MKLNELEKYEQLLSRHKNRIISLAVFGITAIIGAVIFNSLTSMYFDTPIEKAVKKSNEQLQTHYEKMGEELKIMEAVVNNLKERDEIIYQQLFGVDINNVRPYQAITNNRDEIEKREQELRHLPFDELVTTLLANNDALHEKVQDISNGIKKYSDRAENKPASFRSIPSMQPVNNSDLKKNITPTGMCINPFFKSFFLHKGIDYSIPEDTRVFATADGSVQSILSNGASGGTIVLNHGNGYTTLYANLSKTIVKKGNSIQRGDIIGYSGNTGSSFLPHLHYEVKYRDKNLDPFDFFFGELSIQQMIQIREEAAQNIQSFD